MKIQIDATLERDMDLLIIEEFITDKEFANIFLSKVDIGDYEIEEAIHSKTDAEFGESDIVFILKVSGKRHAIHIEDKVDAMAMPNQCDRYSKRAAKDIAKGQYDSYSVLIVAPAKYLSENTEAQKYPCKVTYEELADFFRAKDGARYQYKLALIERAIIEQKNGYQYEADARMVAFCAAINEYQKENYPSLPPFSVAWWPECFSLMKGAKLLFKANKGYCDLQFKKTTIAELCSKVQNFISPRMHIVEAGKSASVRIEVKPIDFEKPFSQFSNEVDEALKALCELYELSKVVATSANSGIHA
jgi:putative lipoic acid-binding regulatory protein